MGTYSDENPNAGIGERLANSVKKIGQAIVGKPDHTPVAGEANPANRETLEAAGIASNTGTAGQSSDAYNKY